jgi:hypothetical protein
MVRDMQMVPLVEVRRIWFSGYYKSATGSPENTQQTEKWWTEKYS